MAAVTLLGRETPGVPEKNLMKVVRFLGGNPQWVELPADASANALEQLVPKSRCLMVSADALASLAGKEWRSALAARAAHVLVYGFGPAESHGRILSELTGGAFAGVETTPTSGCRINVSAEARGICQQFSGLSFEAAGSPAQSTFVRGAGRGTNSVLISLGEKPFVIRSTAPDCQWFLLAGDSTPDLDITVPESRSILEYFSGLVPVLMFLRGAASTGFWHNSHPTACFIIDDPLLKRRYGFLDYQKLLELMTRKRFSTSIAFIPWNHRRSNRRVAELFAAHPRAYSLCVHGCDHTRAEFGGANRAALEQKSQQALDWMARHRESSGLGFDEVMVFPQGIFSTAAMKALRACGYLAAVNSTAYPVDAPSALTLRDRLQVAVNRFSNFPLFTRRYPQRLAELAFDLFLGKPALLVEHHGFFRDGYDALADTVEKVQAMDERLEWSNLKSICSRASLERAGENGEAHIQFFTNRFSFRNDSNEPRNFKLTRCTTGEEAKAEIAVNGRPAPGQRGGDGLQFEVALAPGQSAEIEVALGEPAPRALPGKRDAMYQAKVFLRRSLSEFRDNYLDLNPFVSRAARNRQS
jgi:hypothetical protein